MAIKDIEVPDDKSLGIPRRNMPQIKKKHLAKFMKWLKDEGITVTNTTIKIKELKPTQKDFNLKKVMETINFNREKLEKPLLISKDNYIIDGHHKWLAHLNLSGKNKSINVMQADLTAKDFLAKARQFSKVKYKDVDDNVYKKIDKKQKYAYIINKVKFNKSEV